MTHEPSGSRPSNVRVVPALFVIGGVLLALGPFLPFGSQYNLWATLSRDWGDFLFYVGRETPNPFTYTYLGHVLSIAAPIVLGVVLAACGLLVALRRLERVAPIVAAGVHTLALIAFAFTLWVKFDAAAGESRGGVYRIAAFFVSGLVLVEVGLAWLALGRERISIAWIHLPTLAPIAIGGLLVPLFVPEDAPFSPSGLVVTGVGAMLVLGGAFLRRAR